MNGVLSIHGLHNLAVSTPSSRGSNPTPPDVFIITQIYM